MKKEAPEELKNQRIIPIQIRDNYKSKLQIHSGNKTQGNTIRQ